METNPDERLLQILSGMLIHINALQSLEDTESLQGATLHGELQELEQMARDALSLVRTSTDGQPLLELEGTTLAEALSHMIEQTAEALGLSSRLSFSGLDEHGRPQAPQAQTLSSSAERVLYLIAREALYQVQLHTEARRLRLALNYGPDEVQMSIEDDGLAATPDMSDEPLYEAPAPPFAPESPQAANTAPIINDLRHRIAHLGGSLDIENLAERGTRFLARLPYTTPAISTTQPTDIQPPITSSPLTEQVNILLVDSQTVTRAGLHRLLESYPGLHIIGEAADGVQAVSETLELGPRVVLMDTQLPNGQSLQTLRQIKQLNLDTRVLLLSTQDREEYLYEALRAGADGYVLKDIAPDELAQAVRVVARGEVLVQPQLAGKLLSRFGKQRRGTPYESLTPRELEVLHLLARGLRNKEIAAQLYVSERTVNFHLANIYQKLGVTSRIEALNKALEQGLVTA